MNMKTHREKNCAIFLVHSTEITVYRYKNFAVTYFGIERKLITSKQTLYTLHQTTDLLFAVLF